MNAARALAVARKELIQIRRDPLSMALAFLLPLMLLFIFGYAISMDINHIKTVVCDRDSSPESRLVINSLSATGYFTITGYERDCGKIDRYLDFGRARVAIVIPGDFSSALKTGKTAEAQAIVDGSDANTATIAVGYLTAASELVAGRLSGARLKPAVEPRVRVWYNEDLKSRNFIIPGLIAVIMAVIAALLTSLTIAREWERGTMEQLISTPVKTPELILGKLIPYFLIGFVDVLFAALATIFIFGVELKGSAILLMALSSLFLFGSLSLGILISGAAKNQLAASQVALVSTFLPAFILSGFMFSILNMPYAIQLVTHVIPAKYFVAILKGIFLKGSGLNLLMTEAAVLLVFGAAVFGAANAAFKKRMG
ncbi:MAG: ABC transporter permease [Nitrospinae bacterium]|nr:ABC transporter permease [Nitrospinota bacterium]